MPWEPIANHPGFLVCDGCGELYEPHAQAGRPSPQRCVCRRDPDDSRWPHHDFNEAVRLCGCCRLEAVGSGSRWSVFFCDACKWRVIGLNGHVGRYLVPVGRHSVMAGAGVPGRALVEADAATVDRLIGDLHVVALGMIGGMERLWAFGTHRTRELAAWMGLDLRRRTTLPEWQGRLRDAADREPDRFGATASFEALVRWFAHRSDDRR
jgi:hypothetical protein